MTDTAASMLDLSLAELIRTRPRLAGVFDRLGLDFCCHGQRTLAEASELSGVAVAEVIAAMENGVDVADVAADWSDLGPAGLADHIEAVHHRWLHAEMPQLEVLAAKVLSVHGGHHPELQQVRSLLGDLAADFAPHLAKEERLLFPAIRALVRGGGGFSFGSVANPIAVMTAEHETVGEVLEKLRETTSGFEPPADACASYRLLYQRLEALEADTHLHVFKENAILFPAAIELERANIATR